MAVFFFLMGAIVFFLGYTTALEMSRGREQRRNRNALDQEPTNYRPYSRARTRETTQKKQIGAFYEPWRAPRNGNGTNKKEKEKHYIGEGVDHGTAQR